MFIGHLPAGYCLTTTILNYVHGLPDERRELYFRIGLIASVLPDMDMIYFYLIDHRQHVHHSYWTHLPIFWLMVLPGLLTLGWFFKQRALVWGALMGFSNIALHLFLDSVASTIRWLYPISTTAFGIFQVTAKYDGWIWNYLLHWTFSIEVMVVIMAGGMFYYRKKNGFLKRYRKGYGICR